MCFNLVLNIFIEPSGPQLRVQNYLLLACDHGENVILILLDFSTAFDTVDHCIKPTCFGGHWRYNHEMAEIVSDRQNFLCKTWWPSVAPFPPDMWGPSGLNTESFIIFSVAASPRDHKKNKKKNIESLTTAMQMTGEYTCL